MNSLNIKIANIDITIEFTPDEFKLVAQLIELQKEIQEKEAELE